METSEQKLIKQQTIWEIRLIWVYSDSIGIGIVRSLPRTPHYSCPSTIVEITLNESLFIYLWICSFFWREKKTVPRLTLAVVLASFYFLLLAVMAAWLTANSAFFATIFAIDFVSIAGMRILHLSVSQRACVCNTKVYHNRKIINSSYRHRKLIFFLIPFSSFVNAIIIKWYWFAESIAREMCFSSTQTPNDSLTIRRSRREIIAFGTDHFIRWAPATN